MKRVFFPLLLTTPQVEFPCVSFQNMTTSQSFKQCVSNIPEFAYCKSCMLSSRCTYASTAGKKLIINCFAVLCAILYLLYFANTLPFNRNEVPIIGKLFPLLNSYVHKLHQHFQLFFVLQSLSIAILRH